MTTIFFLVWYTYPTNNQEINSIGIGSLIIIFNSILFLYFYFEPNLISTLYTKYVDLASIYKITGRLAKASLLFISFTGIIPYKFNKLTLLFITIFVSISISSSVYIFPAIFSGLATSYETPGKKINIITYIIINIIIIFLLLPCIYTVMRNSKYKELPYYKYIFSGLLASVANEICISLEIFSIPYFYMLGYVLKTISYFYFFKGISADKFKNINNNLDEPLEEHEEHIKDILNIYPSGIALFNKDFRLIFINKGLEKIIGYKSEEIHGLHIESIVQRFKITDINLIPIIPLINMENIYTKLASKKTDIISIINRNGEKIILSVKYYSLNNNNFLLMLSSDDNSLEIEKVKLQTTHILNSIDSFVVMVDKNNRIISCNRLFQEVTGIKPNNAIGMTTKELCKILNLRFNKTTSISRKYINGCFKTREVTINSVDGTKKHLVFQFTSVKDIEGKNNGYIITGSDITLLKQEQQNIQHQEKLAIIGQLGSGIVHETKNMLASIKGYCQLIYLKTDNDYVKNTIKRVDDITSEVNRIITEFLAFAKPSPQNFKVVFLNNIILSIKYMLESPSFINGVKVEFNLTEYEKPIYADELQIKQVILNMAKNAIEAMADTESPLLVISTSISDSCKEMVFTISDNGKGLSKEDLSKLGTPFYTTKECGTGLGLNTCYRIIEEHNGKIVVESELDKGTKFTIFLPCKSIHKEQEASYRLFPEKST
ncbi:MAG: PAS domain S-box protein [Firmicutes bacterium]|nr:PAS domain S-box protein [Bacillota bacterium]